MSRPVLIANVQADTFEAWLNKTNNVAAYFSEVVTVGANATGDVTTGNGIVNGSFGANTLFVVNGIRGGTLGTAAHLVISSNALFSGSQVNSTANVFVNATNVHVISTVTTILSNSSVTAIKVTGNSSATNTYIGGTTLNLGSDTVAVTNSIAVSGPVNVTNSIAVSNSLLIGTSNIQSIASNTKTTTGTSAQLVDSFDGSAYRSTKYFVSVKDNDANSYNATEIVLIHDGGDSYLTEYARVVSNTILGSFTTNVNSSTVRLYYTPTSSNTTVNLSKMMLVV